jgi:hypothetical protein
MVRLLMNENLAVRIKSTVVLTFILLIIIWFLSALLFQSGIIVFNGGTWLADLNILPSTLLIFGMNLLVGAFGIMLMNQWRTKKGLAVGYYILLLRSSVFHGVLRGTNSFTFPYASHGDIILGFFRVGLWETLALCLICAASASLASFPINSKYGLVSFLKFIRYPVAYLEKQELTIVLVGIGLLMLSALMEALNIHLF